MRTLLIANETVDSDVVRDALELETDASPEVLVVAPALNTRMHHWLSDTDDARRDAEYRLARCVARLDHGDVFVTGWIGDSDPMVAIEDALKFFDAQRIVIATHPESRSNWLARDLVSRARARYALPVRHIVVEPFRETLLAA
jgi:hypothetical protein